MNTFNPEQVRKQVREHSAATINGAIQRINELAGSVDAARLFVAAFGYLAAFAPEGSVSEMAHGNVPAKIETLAYYLYPFFGVSGNTAITPNQIKDCLESLDQLIHMRLMEPVFVDQAHGQNRAAGSIATRARLEAEVVRGSAYPEQTDEEISGIQGHSDNWFARAVGISPTRAKELLWAIGRRQVDAINDAEPQIRAVAESARKRWLDIKKKPSSQRSEDESRALQVFENAKDARDFEFLMTFNSVIPQVLSVGPTELSGIEPLPTAEEWDALINLIGLTTANRARMSSPVDVRERPLFVLDNKRVVLADISHGLDTLWNAFEQAATGDQSFFDRYQKRKADWLEDRVVAHLSKIFPSHCIYQNLTYPDPAKNDGSSTELDTAVLWGPFLVLVEAKASRFRLQSQLKDIDKLGLDLKANIADAFQQARRAARYIDSVANPVFTEPSSGRRLEVNKDGLRRTYLITVSQHLLAGLATKLSLLENLGLFLDHEYPLSISIADLDTVVQFCDGPDVFLHYVEKRLSTQRESLDIEADELDLLGAYLQTRLQPTRLWERDGERPQEVMLVGYSAQFDDWYSYKRGDLSTPPEISLKIPRAIKDILAQLRKRNDDGARWIAFSLLDYSDQVLELLARSIADVKTAEFTPGMFRTMKRKEGDTVVVVVASRDLPRERLQERTILRAKIEKYRLKSQRCIAFGVMADDSSQVFDCAIWSDEPWQYDAAMEEIVDHEPPFMQAPGTKKLGRNEHCSCGSGLKYKRCCLKNFEAGKVMLKDSLERLSTGGRFGERSSLGPGHPRRTRIR